LLARDDRHGAGLREPFKQRMRSIQVPKSVCQSAAAFLRVSDSLSSTLVAFKVEWRRKVETAESIELVEKIVKKPRCPWEFRVAETLRIHSIVQGRLAKTAWTNRVTDESCGIKFQESRGIARFC
jgi:hypothetical protein